LKDGLTFIVKSLCFPTSETIVKSICFPTSETRAVLPVSGATLPVSGATLKNSKTRRLYNVSLIAMSVGVKPQ
jgi:hypothetical protein